MSPELLLGDGDGGEWPPVEMVPVASIVGVDPRYQRHEKRAHIKRIAERFDKRFFGVAILAETTPGEYLIIDGQQRIAAVRLRNSKGQGPNAIPANVHLAGTFEQAEVFDAVNRGRVGLQPYEQWGSRLVRGDEVARDITRIVEHYGQDIGTVPGQIRAVSTLEDIYTGYRRGGGSQRDSSRIVEFRPGPEALEQTMLATERSWNLQPGKERGDVIAGLGMFFSRFSDEELDYDVLHKTMQQMSPAQLKEAHVRHAKGSHGKETRRSAYAKALALAYNQQAKLDGAALLPVEKRFPGLNG